jgi:retinol dehydrogenase-12
MTNLLLDLLKKSKESRIVNVSSMAHGMVAKMNWEDLNFEKGYSRWKAYGQSKLANILFTIGLSKRLKG